MTVKIVYDLNSTSFRDSLIEYIGDAFPKIQTESYNEEYAKEKKKAFMIKASCGTRNVPFVSVYNDEKELIKAFYQEDHTCNYDTITKYLKEHGDY